MKPFFSKFLLRIGILLQKFLANTNKSIFFHELKKNPNSEISNHIKLGKNTHYLISKDAIMKWKDNIEIRNSCNFVAGKNAELIINNNVFFNNYCSVNCLEKIIIGENTLFGEGVKLYDHNHQYSKEKIEHQEFNTSPIIIGKNCWLGSNVIVLKGVAIGDNSIIGAGCIIYKDVPADSIIINKQDLGIKPI